MFDTPLNGRHVNINAVKFRFGMAHKQPSQCSSATAPEIKDSQTRSDCPSGTLQRLFYQVGTPAPNSVKLVGINRLADAETKHRRRQFRVASPDPI
jgi:hypothetical protein